MKRGSILTQITRLVSLCLFPILLYANELPKWTILPKQSSLTFTAIQNNAPISGEFKRFTGEIIADPNQYESSKITINIDMTSLTTSYGDLTTMLLSADWFDVVKFPIASFKATHFNKVNETTYTAEGTLTIRNKTAPVTLTFTAKESNTGYYVVQGDTIIKRITFGVGQGEWADVSNIKDDVHINFKITAQKLS